MKPHPCGEWGPRKGLLAIRLGTVRDGQVSGWPRILETIIFLTWGKAAHIDIRITNAVAAQEISCQRARKHVLYFRSASFDTDSQHWADLPAQIPPGPNKRRGAGRGRFLTLFIPRRLGLR